MRGGYSHQPSSYTGSTHQTDTFHPSAHVQTPETHLETSATHFKL